MKMKYIYIALGVLLVVGMIMLKIYNTGGTQSTKNTPSTPIDVFAQCLTDAGAKFYGAYWCPHCQAQKKLFNDSKFLPYVECSTPNGQAQTKICIDAKITGYPTWEFKDGSRLDGEQTFESLAGKTNCSLPT